METTYRVIDLTVNFEKRRLILHEIEANKQALLELLNPQGGYNIGIRKEALILDFAAGRFIAEETGIIAFHFRGATIQKVQQPIIACTSHICETLGWPRNNEPISVNIEIVSETTKANAGSFTAKHLDVPALETLLSQKIPHAGLTLFLTPLDTQRPREDVRVRIEPLAKEPHQKLYVRLSLDAEDTRIAKIEAHLARCDTLLGQIQEAISAS
ncbi:hypothetical protein HYS50_00525 [Candidatus Woesearchaeota archaeon]|nr:hypothetical protein [Candidatus Woesearchaeota archaeon]